MDLIRELKAVLYISCPKAVFLPLMIYRVFSILILLKLNCLEVNILLGYAVNFRKRSGTRQVVKASLFRGKVTLRNGTYSPQTV